MPETPRISEAEWEIMRLVWDRKKVTAQEVIEEVGPEMDWNPRTVKTLLSRLVKKGALGFELDGKRYVYHPLVARTKCIQEESKSFAQRVFGGSVSPLVAHFLKRSRLSPEEINELKQILADQEKKQ